MSNIQFEETDFLDRMPVEGYYPSTISSARYRRSSSGNRMIEVVHSLQDVPAAHERIADYFVIEGSNARGVTMARWRLVQLYRACGFDPQSGEQLQPSDLLNARVEVRIKPDYWEGQPRPRVIGYRRPQRSLGVQ